MWWNIGSTFNRAYVGQGNLQSAGNYAWGSWGAVQGLGQGAANNAAVVQIG